MKYNIFKKCLEIHNEKTIFVYEENLDSDLSDNQIKSLETDLNKSLSIAYGHIDRNLYHFPIETILHWEYKLDEKYELGGQINLHNILVSISSPKNKLTELYLKEKIDSKEEYFFFDKNLYDGESIGTLIKFANDKLSLCYLMDDGIHDLTLNIEDYLNFLSKTRGFLYWQMLFFKEPIKEKYRYIDELHWKRMFQDLPRLFPKDDFSELFSIYERVVFNY